MTQNTRDQRSIYNIHVVERKWREKWQKDKVYKTAIMPKCKYYCLEMWPYPSGRVHIGHIRNYTIGDVQARFKNAQGYDVLHPMGWDAFGLPAENAAIELGIAPEEFTKQNIARMKEDLMRFGFSYDWDCELTTCKPDYYKYTQELFLLLWSKGLVYKANALVNWDPVEKTVLANEQVVNGKGWRSGVEVEQKYLPHWFIRITDYAQDLLDGLNNIEWPEHIKTMQRNWIGKSEGVEFVFDVVKSDVSVNSDVMKSSMNVEKLRIFTTQQHTIFAATFCAVSFEHPLALHLQLSKKQIDVKSNIDLKNDVECISYDTGFSAIHPITDRVLPIVAVNYVLADYGTGAVFVCPAHDSRDLKLVKQMKCKNEMNNEMICVIDDKGFMIQSEFLNGLTVEEAKKKIIEYAETKGFGKRCVNFKLRDWGVSRQRIWGCPIPIAYCEKCGEVPYLQLHPSDRCADVKGSGCDGQSDRCVDVKGSGCDGQSKDRWWNEERYCKRCSSVLVPEVETLDTFVDSAWYFFRYAAVTMGCIDKVFDAETIKSWLPVDLYIGGIEHAVMHLLYARFFAKAIVDDRSFEPFTQLLSQGMVLNHTYQNVHGQYIYPETVKYDQEGNAIDDKGLAVTVGPAVKMSKSLKNDIDLSVLTEAFGVDAIRLAVLSDSPPTQTLQWSERSLQGCWRFVRKIYDVVISMHSRFMNVKNEKDDLKSVSEQDMMEFNVHIQHLTQNLDMLKYNLYVSRLYMIVNWLQKQRGCNVDKCIGIFVRVIEPIIPHLAQELWEMIREQDDEEYLYRVKWSMKG